MDETGNMMIRQRNEKNNRTFAGKQFSKMNVLVVDGDEITAGYAAHTFGRLGISCEIAENTEHAVRMIREAAVDDVGYDVCLLDCGMDKSGMDETLNRIRKHPYSGGMAVVCVFDQGSDCEGAVEKIGRDYRMERPILQADLYQLMAEISKDANLLTS